MIPEIVLLISAIAVVISVLCALRGRLPKAALAAQGVICAMVPALIIADLNRMAQIPDFQGMIDVLPAWLWGCIILIAIVVVLDVVAAVRERRNSC
ncbi:MAG TPA: hypothetical protein IAD14_08215 [Candidatus Coprousia avicola]|nr:hypothetical protein [Candidatus Coprousia avicola]